MLTPAVSSSQPIGLRTRRTISAPTEAYASVETGIPAWEMASFRLKSLQVSAVRTAPATAIRTDPAHTASISRGPVPAVSGAGMAAGCLFVPAFSVPAVIASPFRTPLAGRHVQEGGDAQDGQPVQGV